MNNLYKIINIFYKYASFLSRKQIREDKKELTSLIDVIDQSLTREFGPNGAKYFGVIFDSIKDINNPNENIDDAINTIKTFNRIKQHLPNQNINNYNSYEEFNSVVNQGNADLIEKSKQKSLEKEEQRMLGGVSEDAINRSIQSEDSTKLYEDEEDVVFRINSQQGANALANDTSWCITRLGQGYYTQYTSNNLIFYFVINKTKPLNDKFQKVAIRVMKYKNKITNIEYTNKLNNGDHNNPTSLPGYNKYKDIIINDANQQPEGLLSKVKSGIATDEEINKLWDDNKLIDAFEKEELLKYFPKKFKTTEKYKEFLINKTATLSKKEEAALDFKTADPIVLEKLATITDDEKISLKLYNTKISFVQKIVISKTKNINILLDAILSKNNDFIEAVKSNKYAISNVIIIKTFIKLNVNVDEYIPDNIKDDIVNKLKFTEEEKKKYYTYKPIKYKICKRC
jgi:hypothetical protein